MKSEDLNKINNSFIWKKDKKQYAEQIIPFIKEGTNLNIFASFVYLTPNHTTLFALEELKRISPENAKIFIVFWDLNVLANPYVKKLLSNGKIEQKDIYLEQKSIELKNMAISIGFKEEQLFIYKSSDIWKRLISYKNENLFQVFYSIISQLKIKDFLESNKVSNSLKIPLDVFYCNYFSYLFPEDLKRPIDLFFTGEDRIEMHELVRKEMTKEGLITNKKPLFYILKKFPQLLYENHVPEWEMDIKEIKNILYNVKLNVTEMESILRNIFLSTKKELKWDLNILKDLDKKEIKSFISKELYIFLKEKRKNFERGFKILDKSI